MLYIVTLAFFTLAVTSFVYGWKFLGRRNYLLGIEWWIVTVSASNLVYYFLSGGTVQLSHDVSFFLDAFSRAVGFPIIAIVGLMAVTHRYKPSVLTEFALFGSGFVVAAILIGADFVVAVKPYFYLVMWIAFATYLAYFVSRLLRVGENLQALGLVSVIISTVFVAGVYDFYNIPGDDDKLIFFTIAGFVWSYAGVWLYYSYCALERAESR